VLALNIFQPQAQPAGRLVRDASIDPATNPLAGDRPRAVAQSQGGGEYEDALALDVGIASDR